jgi:hypothetical protein
LITTYKPLLLIFGYLLGGVFLLHVRSADWLAANVMQDFMGGFFLIFSFFKLLNLRGFANAYRTYDVVAKRIYGYGFVYPVVELSLGVAYVIHFNPPLINSITVVVSLVSSVGVIQSLLSRKKIPCACLGTIFNLPMTKVTLIEDLLMAGMAGVMLVI